MCRAMRREAQPELAKTWMALRAPSPPVPPVADWVRWDFWEWPICVVFLGNGVSYLRYA